MTSTLSVAEEPSQKSMKATNLLLTSYPSSMRYRVAISGVLSLLLCCATPPLQAMDLVEIYQAALVRDPILASAIAVHTGGVEQLEQAQAKLGTTIQATATAGLLQSHLEGFPQSNGSTTQGSISLNKPIYHPADSVVVDQAKFQISRLDAQLSGARQDLVLRVAQAYFNMLLAQDLLRVTRLEHESIGKQLAQAQRSYEIGTVPITDVTDARARLDLSAAIEVQNLNDLEVARHALEQLSGMKVDSLAGLSLTAAMHPPQPEDIEYWVADAQMHSPLVMQASASLASQEKEIDHARAGRYPTVDLVASVSKQNYSQSGLDSTGTAGRSAEVGVVLSVPLWDGGLRSSTIRQAVAGADQAQNDLQASRDLAAQSARQFYTGVMTSIAQTHAFEQAVESGRVSLEGSLRGQQVGTRTAVDVLNARQQLFQTERQLAASRYAAALNMLQLKAVAGELTPRDLEGLTSAAITSGLSATELPIPH